MPLHARWDDTAVYKTKLDQNRYLQEKLDELWLLMRNQSSRV